jgi:hypothetical protein
VPIDITSEAALAAVHRVRGDVKIVKSITVCRPDDNNNRDSDILGCAWRKRGLPTIILAHEVIGKGNPQLWAHEFGHTKGLPHRDDREALMHCRPNVTRTDVTPDECESFRRPGRVPSRDVPSVTCSPGR